LRAVVETHFPKQYFGVCGRFDNRRLHREVSGVNRLPIVIACARDDDGQENDCEQE
jgi:hypothetical protein